MSQDPYETAWQNFKNAFDAWENATAPFLETLSKNPALIGPAGALLSAFTRFHAFQQRAAATWWSSFGLPTRADQERSLHAMNELQSRLIDLEEKLEDLQERR